MITFEEYQFKVKHSNINASPKTFDNLEDGDFLYWYVKGRPYATKIVFKSWSESGEILWYTAFGTVSNMFIKGVSKKDFIGKTFLDKNEIYVFSTSIEEMRKREGEQLKVNYCDPVKHKNYEIEE